MEYFERTPKHLLHYKILRELGKGSFGRVYLAKDTCDYGQIVAVKCLGWIEKYTDKELEIARKLEPQDNIVTMLELFGYEDNYCIVMEYCEGGNLNDHILNQRPCTHDVLKYMIDVAKGVYHLHSRDVLHRDLKAANVLLQHNGSRWICKIADFSISTSSNAAKTDFGHFFQAPEIGVDDHYKFPADIYSLGLLYFVMYTKNFEEYNGEKVLAPYIKHKDRRCHLNTCVKTGLDKQTFKEQFFYEMPSLGDLVCKMLQLVPRRRPNAQDVIAEVAEITGAHKSTMAETGAYKSTMAETKTTHSDAYHNENKRYTRKERQQSKQDKTEATVPRRLPELNERRHQPPGLDVTKIKDTFQMIRERNDRRRDEDDESDVSEDEDDDITLRHDKNKEEVPGRNKDSTRDSRDSGLGSSCEVDACTNRGSDRKQKPADGFNISQLKYTLQLQREKCHLFPRRQPDEYDNDDSDEY